MQEFSFSTRVFFGSNALERLRKLRHKKIMVVTDEFIVTSGIVDRVTAHISDCEITVFSEVVPDPTNEVVIAGVKCLQQCNADVMIAVGGGSAIDAAKAIRTVAKHQDLHIAEIEECFAIPTTSGTGSEVTEYAVITNAQDGVKQPLVSRDLRPPVAILDPSLVITAPPHVTADSGMDVLAHAIEAYVSTGSNDFADALAEKSMELVLKYLPLAHKDGGNLEAREKMHNASCMAGLAFNSAGLGLCHGLAHAIGSKFHIAHGRANAMILPHIIQFNASCEGGKTPNAPISEKYRKIAKILGLPAHNTLIGVNQLVRTIEGLCKSLEIPTSLKKAGVEAASLALVENEIVEAALSDLTTTTNPRIPTAADIKTLLNAISGY